MISELKHNVRNHYINCKGWRTDRKIIVIESDDWGAIRMSSREALQKITEEGIDTEQCHYMQNDALASENDLEKLFDLLTSHKNTRGEYPVITANVIMGNPDFEKIKSSGFNEYHYEHFTDSLAAYPEHRNSFSLWKEGMRDGIFHPQFHGREHLQVKRWMHFLQDNESETRIAFENGVFGLSTTVTTEQRASYMAAYDWNSEESRDFILNSIAQGLSLFKSTFGFNSLSAIAPNYTWHPEVERVFEDHGVRYLQGGSVQRIPALNRANESYKRHFTGHKNDLDQIYLVRNCIFEPSSNPELDWVEKCLKQIETAFLWKKPAIVEMHRVNVIGYINSENRDRNLKKFDRLLQSITRRWPEVEFMTTNQLGQIIENNE